MKPENRHRLLTIALELRLGYRASSSQTPLGFPPPRLLEIAQAIENLVEDDEAAANANDPRFSRENGSVADGNS